MAGSFRLGCRDGGHASKIDLLNFQEHRKRGWIFRFGKCPHGARMIGTHHRLHGDQVVTTLIALHL
jgi:hypothetical protein